MVAFLVWSAVLGFLLGSVTVTLLQALLPRRRHGELRLAHPVPDRRSRSAWSASTSGCGCEDTPAFEALSDSDEVADSPLKEAVTTAWVPILQVIGLMIIHNVGFYVVFTYLPTYFIKTLHFSKMDSFISITLASLVALALILPLGALSDRIGRRPLLIAGAAGFAVLAYPAFMLLNSGSLTNAVLAHCLLGAIEAVFVSASLVAATELFATRVRYSGLSVGYNVSVAVFGGTTPYVVTLLAARTGNDYAAGIYVVIAAVVSLLTVLTHAGDRRQTTGGTGSHSSSITVTGPSLTSSTAMSAPNTPVATSAPSSRSASVNTVTSGSATAPGAAAFHVGRRPLAVLAYSVN